MAIPTEKIGKRFGPVLYAVGREKVREYAAAVGESSPVHLSLEAARAAGYADVLAPPMFAVVYAGRAFLEALFDPELEIDFAHLVHGAQEFRWEAPVVAGDEIATVLEFKDVALRAGLRFDTFESVSVNQDRETVSVGTWTNIIRAER
ncbi:MAG: FAS1-like dehydratase domain-containing protein [Solirubrobacteraceae bacterium]